MIFSSPREIVSRCIKQIRADPVRILSAEAPGRDRPAHPDGLPGAPKKLAGAIVAAYEAASINPSSFRNENQLSSPRYYLLAWLIEQREPVSTIPITRKLCYLCAHSNGFIVRLEKLKSSSFSPPNGLT